MRIRYFAWTALIVLLPLIAAGQTAYKAPKTPWGDPDIQGQWPASADIPMQRPASLGTRTTFTDEELAQREKQAQRQAATDTEKFVKNSGDVTINPPSYWQERQQPNRQTSLVVDPPDGRIPPMTPEGQQYVRSLRGGLGPG